MGRWKYLCGCLLLYIYIPVISVLDIVCHHGIYTNANMTKNFSIEQKNCKLDRDFPCKSCGEKNNEPLLTNVSHGTKTRYMCQLAWNATFAAPHSSVQIAFSIQRSDSIPYLVQASLLNLSSINNSEVQSFYQVRVDCMYFEAENIKMYAFDCSGRKINIDCSEDRIAPTTGSSSHGPANKSTISVSFGVGPMSPSDDPSKKSISVGVGPVSPGSPSINPANELTIGIIVGVVLAICLLITGAIFYKRNRMDASARRNTVMSGNSTVEHSVPPAQSTNRTLWRWTDTGKLVETGGDEQSFPEDPEESLDNWEGQLRDDLPLQFVEGTTYYTVNQSTGKNSEQTKQHDNSPRQLVINEAVASHGKPNSVDVMSVTENCSFNESGKANSVTPHARNEFRPPDTLRSCDQFHRDCVHQMPIEITKKMLAFNVDD